MKWCLASALALGVSAASAHKAHVHGEMKLLVTVEGAQLSVSAEVPLDNLLGFERAPRSEAERQAAAAVLARWQDPVKAPALLAPSPQAQCSVSQAKVMAPVLQGPAGAAAQAEHAELEASYTWTCQSPAALASLEVALWAAYPRVSRIEVLVAGPKGQHKTVLKRPRQTVSLSR
ncbi:DUF2796 domain-containing protein [Ideonella sp.]|uniref:ZrgA family zinc uptake protein n=1 Tax=Ideonella sp. TaxID=1929293 RepID=UPI0037BE5802